MDRSSDLSALCSYKSKSKSKSPPVCLICIAIPYRSARYYCIFIIDPFEKLKREFVTKHPTLRFHPKDGTGVHAFHVFGSTLYIFEAGYACRGKSVYSLDLSDRDAKPSVHLDSHTRPIDLKEIDVDSKEQCMLKKEKDMNGWKSGVFAVATPCGRYIMVCSIYASVGSHSSWINDEGRCDFELYDPIYKSWTALPQLDCKCYLYPDLKNLFISSYEFVSKHLFVIYTDNGTFSLDIEKQCWKNYGEVDDYFGAKHILVGDEFFLTDSHIVRLADGVILAGLPPPMPMPRCLFSTRNDPMSLPEISCIGALLDHDADQFIFCFSHATVDKQTGQKAYITFDVWQTNLAEYRRKEEMLGQTRLAEYLKKEIWEKMMLEFEEMEMNEENLKYMWEKTNLELVEITNVVKFKDEKEKLKEIWEKVELEFMDTMMNKEKFTNVKGKMKEIWERIKLEFEKEKLKMKEKLKDEKKEDTECVEGEKKKKKRKKKKDIRTTEINSFGMLLAKQGVNLSWFTALEMFPIVYREEELIDPFDKMDISR